MFKKFNGILVIFLFSFFSQNSYGFDLKSLTDKIQKDLGDKLQTPKGNSNNNPLGGMLKGLKQKNNVGVSSNVVGSNNISVSSGNTKLAKGICEPNIPQTIKDLPKGNISLLEKDFGKSQNEIKKIVSAIPNTSDDPYVSSLKTFEGAFETKEIETIFNNFVRKKSLNDLASLRSISGLKAGFNNNKKQIKADALFAYGLIHYYLRNVGGNKNLGIEYIKLAKGSPDNIGALTVYGAWQFYGLNNIKQNIEAGNMAALTGYQRADEKKFKINESGPFRGLNPFKWAETVFFEIAADNRNPYKAQYQSQLQQAKEMNKKVMEDLAKSEKNDAKSGWWPFVIAQQNMQHDILNELADNLGLGEQLSELKAQYAVLKSKVSEDNKYVEKMVIVNEEMNNRIQKALDSAKAVDDKGKIQIANLAHDNEILILKNNSFVISLMANMMAGGGFGNAGFYELTKIAAIAGGNSKVACEVYTGVKSYASRTKITLPEPVKTETAKTRTKFRKKKKRS